MQQLDIYWAQLSPTEGSEQSGLRPIVIISGNSMNDNLGICIACPLTQKIKQYPGCVTIIADQNNNLTENSEVITFQVRTIAKSRLRQKIGVIQVNDLEKILAGLSDIFRY